MQIKLFLIALLISITSLPSFAQVNKENKIKFTNQTFLPISVGPQHPLAIGTKVKFFSTNENEIYIGGVSVNFDSIWLIKLNHNLKIESIYHFSNNQLSSLGINRNNTLESISIFKNQVYYSFSNGTMILIDKFDDSEKYYFQFLPNFGAKHGVNAHQILPIAYNEFIIIGNKIDTNCKKNDSFNMVIY